MLNAIMSRPSIRHKKSTMIKWLNEYSETSNDRARAKRDTHESQMIPVIRHESAKGIKEEESEDSADEALVD